ncbi:MAG: TetR/AcrR family transcriptional regulator [Actinobacteria bacterium]|nr:TetR/AcrR family transcriptional regulator [Actinomycetota bacterium]
MARPRQRDIDDRLVAAWRELAADRPYGAITMEAVAERAGVGKPALYLRHPTKAHLAFAASIVESVPAEPPDHGALEADLLDAVRALVASLASVPREVFADRIGAVIADADFAHQVQEELSGPALEAMATLWERARVRGEVDPALDGRSVLDDLAGALIFRVVVRHQDAGDAYLREVVGRFARAVSPGPA